MLSKKKGKWWLDLPHSREHFEIEIWNSNENRCSVPLFVANLQPQPPQPPDVIVTEHDRQVQIAFEQWLTNQDTILGNQLKYYQIEVSKLRKTRKSLNSKQRILKKAGNELTDADTIELNKVSADQTIVQKQLENARKLSRQHGLLVQDYKSKQQAKMAQQMVQQQQQQQQPINHPGTPPDVGFFPRKSPHPAAPDAPMMSPMSAQSPLSNPMLQPPCSPLHSPSPLMSQSPVPGARYAFSASV